MEFSNDNEALSGRLQHDSKVYNLSQSKTPGRWTIGRHPANDVALSGRAISNFHCILVFSPDVGFILTDLSSNGSWINNTFVGQGRCQILRPGDLISLPSGDEFLYFRRAPFIPDTSIWSQYGCGAELGRGAFASVHRCLKRTTGVWYAVKVINRRRFQFEGASERMFQREIEALKALKSSHEHIVQLKEIFEETNTLYLVMEYVSGGNLGEYLDMRPPLSERIAQEFAIQICGAVVFIHEQGVAHRDLKPENILLTTDKPPRLKIADFGLAKLIATGTQLRTQCGTPDYMAPEVAHSFGLGYSPKVDSWSVGVIIFHMLTKQLPFHWSSNPRLDIWESIAQRTMDLDPLLKVNCSKQCFYFIQNLLQEDPEKRWPITCIVDGWVDSGPVTVLRPVASPPKDHYEVGRKTDSTEAVYGSDDDESFSMDIPGAYPPSLTT